MQIRFPLMLLLATFILSGLTLSAVESAVDKKPVKATASALAKEKKAEEPKIPGVVMAYGEDAYIALTVENGFFCLRLYDAKKKRAPLGALAKATVRWNESQKDGTARCVLLPGSDGVSLMGNKFVRQPRIFPVHVTLLDGEGKALQSLTFSFKE